MYLCLFSICFEGHEFISILYCQVPPSKNKVDYYLEREREIRRGVFTPSIKRPIRTFHVQPVQLRQRNAPKIVMHV